MQRQVSIIDDFAPDPVGIRKAALALDYKTVNFGGHDFHGVGIPTNPKFYQWIGELIQQAVGFPINVRMGFFRLGMVGSPMTSFIHADRDCGEFAGVLYLNLPDQKLGGTAFWEHKATQWRHLPEHATQDQLAMFGEDGDDECFWRQWLMVPMQFNRFITYRTSLFHSRYPNNIEAVSKEEGRLVFAVFFDRKEGA